VSWHVPDADLALDGDAVHVWRADSDCPGSRLEDLRKTLSADELARAERFYLPRDRDRFIARRSVLRAILGRYIAIDPSLMQFEYGTGRKPALAARHHRAQLRFNVSHSAGLVLYAITRSRDIGVDVERIEPAIAAERIPEQFFSPREVAELRSLPVDVQPEAFFTCWTRKEAYVKAKGLGLALRLDRFDVSLSPGKPAALLRTADDAHEASRWSMRALAPAAGYAGALVVEGHAWQLSCWRWTA